VRAYSVSALTLEVDQLLQSRYPHVLVEGEISQLNVHGSGHAYLTLRDEKSSIQCVAWRSTWRSLRFQPHAGDRVLVRGRLSIYGARGSFQLYVSDIRPAGVGDLAKEIEARKARLEAEGLLDPRRKRPLPPIPRVVGVATSLTGAALQDFLQVSGRRFPSSRVLVAGCIVQGKTAPASILRAVELLIMDGRSEVIVVTRGGGSNQDLMAFNDEHLARFLAHCPVPVLSAVGHQVDTTIADLVADVVEPTPSAAAARVFPDGLALAQAIDDATTNLSTATTRYLRLRRAKVESLQARLRHPAQRLRSVRQRLQHSEERLYRAMQVAMSARRATLDTAEGRLKGLSPTEVLSRGYAIVHGPNGIVVDGPRLSVGDRLHIRFARGQVEAVVN
jgi:exodeoxyribonuclease VII large subunit